MAIFHVCLVKLLVAVILSFVCLCVCAQSCLNLCNPMDCSLPGSSVHEIFQAKILEWVGRHKSEVMAERLRDINPDIELHVVTDYIRDEKIYELLDAAHYDYVIDCIDTLSPKVNLIAGALERNIPLVSSMGAGAKTDPTQIEIKDIGKSHHCPLAHMLRKRLHKLGIRSGFYAVFSPEPVREGAMILAEETNKKSNVGTISYIPAVFGCACASVVIRDLLGEM